jgi:hypothetical protein
MTSVPLGDLEMPERLPDLVVDHLPQGPCQPPQVVWPWRTEVAQRFRVVRRVQQDGSGVRRLIVSVVVPLHLHRCECICMRPPTLALSVGPAGIWEWSCDYRHSHDFEILRFREVRQ